MLTAQKIRNGVLLAGVVLLASHCTVYILSFQTQKRKFAHVSLEGIYTNPEHPLIGRYLDVYRQFPTNRVQFQEFLRTDSMLAPERNLPVAESNGVLQFLIDNNTWHISFSPDEKWFFVYDDGPNFRNDSMSEFVTHKDLNFWNYYLKKADVLIFKQKIELPYSRGENSPKPPSP